LVLVALIFTAALLPYVEWLVRRGLPRVASVLTVLAVIVLALAGLFALVVPAMVDEFHDLRENLPQDARDFEDYMENFGFDTENWDLPERAERIRWGELISGDVAVDYGQRVVFGLLSALTVVVLTAYFLIDAPKMAGYIYRYVPPGREPDVDAIMQALGRVVGGYIRGQVITSAVITVFTLVVLLATGVPNAIAFAVLAGFADVIPLVGAFIAVIPPAIAAFQESPTQALIVLGALVLYQQFEDRFLVPRVYGSTLNLPPIAVLIAVLAGAEVLGVAGILLALPATAAGRVLLDYWLDRRAGISTVVGPTDEVAAPDIEPEPGEASSG
ncbi:MAG: AI-2E family transporter, partial [Hyphomicrobiales bacterium]